MRLYAPLLLAALGLALGSTAGADPISKRVGLVVEGVAAAAQSCGVSTEEVRSAAESVLSEAGWTLKEGVSDFVYVNVDIAYGPTHSTCAFNISAALARRIVTGYGGHTLAFTEHNGARGRTPSTSAAQSILDSQQGVIRDLIAKAEVDQL